MHLAVINHLTPGFGFQRPYIWHDWGKNQKRLKIEAEQEKVRQENEAIAQLKQQRVAK